MVYEIFGKNISGPFTIPAGIVTTEVSVLEKIANEVPEVGILTTKSIGPALREGYNEPILAGYATHSFINAVGLANPGAGEFANRLSKIRIPDDKFLLISIFGGNTGEFVSVAETLWDYADGYELNVSCPHSSGYGQGIGQDSDLVRKITREVSQFNKPVVVKLSPNLDVKKAVEAAVKGGASGFTAINTRGPELFLHDDYPVLSNSVGGVSGRAILILGLKCVEDIRSITNLPIIACGGISIANDVGLYKDVGADFFGVGSALAGKSTEQIKEYFSVLSADLANGTNNAWNLIKEVDMSYKKFKLEYNNKLADDLSLLRFTDSFKASPGQFVFVWIPEVGEKPFSVFDDSPLTLLVQKRGPFTSALSGLQKNGYVYVRGSYGNSPDLQGRVLLVGGGTGIASLYLFAKNFKSTALLGAKDGDHLPAKYINKFRSFCNGVYLTTENGDVGRKGLVTDDLEGLIKKVYPSFIVNCGPQAMVEAAVRKELNYLSPERIYSSMDFITRCGVGLCGRCSTSKGYRNCVDGTFFTPDNL